MPPLGPGRILRILPHKQTRNRQNKVQAKTSPGPTAYPNLQTAKAETVSLTPLTVKIKGSLLREQVN
jgi:hypothetical protein